MTIRTIGASAIVWAALLLAGGCGQRREGPIEISAIGGQPRLVNPNLAPIDPPEEILLLATAQGLVRLDASGQIEPALAQSWIVSDDGLRYTFRLHRTNWANGGLVTAQQVAERLQATIRRTSKNPLKPLLGAIDEIVAMTDEVLEISLVSPHPHFLQILAMPEMAIIRNGAGTGPYHALADGNILSLHLPRPEEEENEDSTPSLPDRQQSDIRLRGERAGLAIARFMSDGADLVTGGTFGDLPVARAAKPGGALQFDPVAGLFGLRFVNPENILTDASVRDALNMAIDRDALISALDVPDLQPRQSLLPNGLSELSQPAVPAWTKLPLGARRVRAADTINRKTKIKPLYLRVAVPDGPGYRLIFAYLRHDWRTIGVQAEMVKIHDRSANLELIDQIAPATLASWYLRQFTCVASAICDAAADAMMDAARTAATSEERQGSIANADRILADTTPFIPLAAPVRWSLISRRLTGFQPNPSGHHNIAELVAKKP